MVLDMVKRGGSWTNHLANERTFLAWIRTNLGIMAFGFVVEKFSFFIQKIALVLGKSGEAGTAIQGYSSTFGISLVSLGALLCVFAFFKYRKTGKEIDEDVYPSSNLLVSVIASLVFLIGVFLIIYLFNSERHL